MNTQQKVNARPSQAHVDPSVMRAKADEANRKRKARQQEAKWEAENKAAEEAAQAQRKADEEAAKAQPEPEVRSEPEVKVNSSNLGKKINVTCDGVEYPSINAALRGTGEILWANETDYRRSCWTKINRELKKTGTSTHSGHTFTTI